MESIMPVFATKYFVLSPERLNETIGRALATELNRENIWNCIIVQSGKYRGLKFGVNSLQEAKVVKGLMVVIKERTKTLKSVANTPILTEND